MPTRTIAKRISLRQRSPAKVKPKRKAKGNKCQKNLKRKVDTDNDESHSETSDSEESEPKVKKKRPTKRQRRESSEVAEVRVDNPTKQPIEEVEDVQTLTSDDNDVSVNSTEMTKYLHVP